MFKKYFSNFLHYAVIIALIFPFRYGISHLLYLAYSSRSRIFIIFAFIVYLTIIFYYKNWNSMLQRKLASFSTAKLLCHIIVIGFILRLLWILSVPTTPVSDFKEMYEAARQVSISNFSSFHGTSYFARFTHSTVTTLFFSIFYKFSDNPLFLIKLSNVVFQTVAIYALYLVSKKLFGKDKALCSSLVIALFPPFIMYTSQVMSENIAMPLYIFSIYFFITGVKEEKEQYFLFTGLFLSAANMFRMVGVIFITAYIVYNFIYKEIKTGLKTNFIIICAYLIPLYLVSQGLMMAYVTETHLWKPKESNFTSILRGSSIEYHGRWNEEDASLPEKYNYDMEKVNEAAKEIVIKRLTTTPINKLAGHFITKLSMQWGIGDFAAPGWTIDNAKDSAVTSFLKYYYYELCFIIQLAYLTMLIRTFIALFKKEYTGNEQMNFFYILFGGFVLLYLISENQERYAFIVSWLFIIFQARTCSQRNRLT